MKLCAAAFGLGVLTGVFLAFLVEDYIERPNESWKPVGYRPFDGENLS